MITVDLIKTAYRQTKDGFAITFTVHPQDDHSELAKAEIGSQWQATFTPLDDDGNANPGHVLAPGREKGGTALTRDPSDSRRDDAPYGNSSSKSKVVHLLNSASRRLQMRPWRT